VSGRALVLDAGALIHAEREPRGQVVSDCRTALSQGIRILLPAVVYAQVWRGAARQQGVAVVCRICHMLSFTADTANTVGRILQASKTSDVVDAAVVAAAIEHGAAVLTSDPGDIAKLADAVGYRVPLVTV
jgi:predicted nucleic acid-binding protein